MEQAKIDRINALAKKAKSPEGLTPEETAERDRLRREYIAAYRASPGGPLGRTPPRGQPPGRSILPPESASTKS